MKRSAAALPLLLLALAAPGCGFDDSDGSEGTSTGATAAATTTTATTTTEATTPATPAGEDDQRAIRQAAAAAADAYRRQDWDDFCALLTPAAHRRVERRVGGERGAGDCGTVLRKLIADAGPLPPLEVDLADVTVTGDRARATNRGAATPGQRQMAFARIDGRWRLDLIP
ncbi:hypothetical protein [Patulibacter defluvii]|uniref:hypothetical protein n=1 Tax=Patulibacter defluvii TaxID=3095358 RepID=UPI002A748216|nr:hypothetical protein [Patulibacter sp. DM4]